MANPSQLLTLVGEPPKSMNPGSRWYRWEPHVHAPGTVLNDQFKGPDAWEQYLKGLESASPQIRAVGITDYYSMDVYERVLQEKAKGRLANCDLIFPNVEMRLSVGTVKGKWVNVHLLVSPDNPNHVAEMKRLLARLAFKAFNDSFACTRDDLVRLGKKSDPKLTDEGAALAHGSEQFKVSFDDLKKIYNESAWAQENVLVAVAGSETDGTSGVRDAADATLRQEVEKFAHIIFASSPSQRDYWLGRKAANADELRDRYDGAKPCLHGSDAHDQRTVGVPDGDRYSWIKGALEFDALRQACIDPLRAFVGTQPPPSAMPSQVISRLKVSNAPWARTPDILLNPGLVAIIGARGSGKTALADMIAAGCGAITGHLSTSSFLNRANELLGDAAVQVHWEEGESSARRLDAHDDSATAYPRVRYLSQKFVEELCSASGITDELLREVERVIFEAHAPEDRDGAVDFDELLELKANRHRQAREREEEALAQISDRIGSELEKNRLVGDLRKQVKQKEQQLAGYISDRAKLVTKGSEQRVVRLGALMTAAEKVRGYLRYYANQEQSLLSLKDEVSDFRRNRAPEALRRSQERFAATGIKGNDWSPFLLDYKGDVDTKITAHLATNQTNVATWKGSPVKLPADQQTQLIADDAKLDTLPLALLEAETSRLQRLINVDKDTASKFAAVSKRITDENTALERLKERLADCEQAKARAVELVEQREAAYLHAFEAIAAEEEILRELYKPLVERLTTSGDTLKKLSFSIVRVADLEHWAKGGEELFDLRRQGPFRGKGTLLQRAEVSLKAAWETGDAKAAATAMAKFREDNEDDLLAHGSVPKDPAERRAWLRRFAKWLYSTGHISLRYSLDYDGVDIRKLSPGTRGIVLLLLYLSLDDADDRPLIIDQPEENLDPKSVYDELVSLFVAAKSRRQVIMVTHNANLVVNTDADQIIVAQAGPHPHGELPPITYVSGGLENAHIRKIVCDILEGGEDAFKERARRLRVRLQR